MSDFFKQIKEFNDLKDELIEEIRKIPTEGVSNSQAQNVREYSVRTNSIEEIKLYLKYQMSREKELIKAGNILNKLIEDYKDKGIDAVRYIMGTFARCVAINEKLGE